MKKISVILMAILLLVSFSGCSKGTVMTPTANWGKTNVYEKSVYNVTVQESEGDAIDSAPKLSGTGSYVTILSGDSKTGYTYETTMNFDGAYMLDGKSIPVKDSIKTTVTFADVMYNQKPVSSERVYDGHTVVYEDGKYSIEELQYKTTVKYDEKKAYVTAGQGASYNEPISNIPTTFDFSLPTTSNLYDNEQVAVALRSFVKSFGASTSIDLVSGLNQGEMDMSVSIASEAEKVSTSINNRVSEIDCYLVRLAKSSSDNQGAPIYYYYAINDKGIVHNESGNEMSVDRSRLVKIEQNIAFTGDVLTFDLVEYTYGK